MLPARYFPKELFKRYLFRQVGLIVPTMLLGAFFLRLSLQKSFVSAADPADLIRKFDSAFFLMAVVLSLVAVGVSFAISVWLSLPLGRILMKARSIQRKEYPGPTVYDQAGGEEAGEWSDLETALNRIARNMRIQDTTLTRERMELQAIISAITEAVIAVDLEGNILFFNTQFARFFGGYARKDIRLSDIIRNPDVLEAFRESLKKNEAVFTSMPIPVTGENLPRHFLLSVAPLKNEQGEIYGAVGTFHDVSELKRLDQVRIDFVANVSHELRSPLTSIKGYVETIKQSPSDSMGYLDRIERNTDRLIALVNDLLQLSALESGNDLHLTDIRLHDLTDRVVSQLDQARAMKNHSVKVVCNEPLLRADAQRVEQVLYNLLENAIKYVPQRGEIEIRWDREDDAVVLHVKDDGLGIPYEHQSRVFERFYRVDSARSRDQGGTGLGLSIVKHIMQRHGGQVAVRGGPGYGSEFVCTFPQ